MTLQEMFERVESSRLQILDAAGTMDTASFSERRPGVFSVRDLLAHLMDAEDFWIGSVVLGGKHLKFEPERYPDLSSLKADWDKIRDRTGRVFATLTDELLRQIRTVPGEAGTTFEVDRILWRFLAHEIHHGGQICMLMREKGFEPPVLDLP